MRFEKKKRKITFHRVALLCTCAGLLALPFHNAHAISLKEQSVVADDKIRLGDIFYDLPRDEDRVLGAAPRPGQEMVLNSRTLLRIALALELPWRPASTADKVTLRRDSTLIELTKIEGALKTALEAEGVAGDYKLNIPPEFHKINLPPNQPAEVEISKIHIDSDKKSFAATVMAPSIANPIQTLQIRGQIQPVITVPVLKENVQNGRTIQESDIEYTQIRETDFTSDVVTDANALIGMTARRVIIAGRPIKSVDMQAQLLIERGELIMLSLNSGPMNLSTQAKALENGAKGDVIRVLNTASNQTVQGVVTGVNEVTVMEN